MKKLISGIAVAALALPVLAALKVRRKGRTSRPARRWPAKRFDFAGPSAEERPGESFTLIPPLTRRDPLIWKHTRSLKNKDTIRFVGGRDDHRVSATAFSGSNYLLTGLSRCKFPAASDSHGKIVALPQPERWRLPKEGAKDVRAVAI